MGSLTKFTAAIAAVSLLASGAPALAEIANSQGLPEARANNPRAGISSRNVLVREWPLIEGQVSLTRSISAYHAARVFAACSDGTALNLMQKTLAAPADSPKEDYVMRRLADRSRACAVAGEPLPRQFVRGAIAEQLLDGDAAGDVPLFDGSVRPAELEAFLSSGLSDGNAKGLTAQLRRVAACHAALAPGMTRKVLGTKPGSAAERAAMDNLFRVETRCGTAALPEGVSVVAQRSLLADMAYQWGAFRAAEAG